MMNTNWLLVIAATFLGLLFSSCTQEAEVSEQNVGRIIKTLSSDEMMGRNAFESEIYDAADIIAGEFEKIGLSPLTDSADFKQRFTIYSLKPSGATVIINGKELDEQHYFGLTSTEEVNWTSQDTDIGYISEGEDYRTSFRKFSSDDKSSLIVVDEAHNKMFHRYRTYFSRSNKTFELGARPNDIFVLLNGSVNSLDISYRNSIKPIELFNVVGMIEGERKDEVVLFTAHYDHIGVVSPVEEDSIANGANDNASGVSAVIELARYFEKMPKPKRSLYFVGFTAEEMGGYGSKYFSQQLNPDEIIAMFNIEMIGKPAVEGPNTAWITGFDRSTFGQILQESVADSNFVFYADPYPSQNLFYRSDNATLAELGVPAHTISTTPIDVDQDYHKVTDEYSTLNISHTANTIRAIAKAAKVIISGDKTPSRIKTEESLTSTD